MWKNRKELPVLQKINLSFDIEKLKDALKEVEGKDWNASLGGNFNELRRAYGSRLCNLAWDIPHTEEPEDWKSLGYHQLALTEFDEDYEIRTDRNSGSKWDNQFMKNNKKYDERAYSKPLNDLPEYILHLFSKFPHLTRVTLAKLFPGQELKPHMDYDTTFSCRYHMAIETNEQCFINDTHIPADGSVWFLNQGKTHWAVNHGDSPRTHLILKCDSQDLLNEST